MSCSLLYIISKILLFHHCLCSNHEDSAYWSKLGNDELKESLSIKWNLNIAKNVILFIGDGMSIDTITASRIYHQGETSYLAWEKLPHLGLIKTYNTNKRVPDSASTATALFSGVKTNYNVLGVDSNVKLDDCQASLNPKYQVTSIIEWAQEAGKATGFVTTTRVTHATPAPLYAHTPNRRWECENKIPPAARNVCKDIARQLIENAPGKNINVIMGGGRQVLQSNVTGTIHDPIDTWSCYSTDNRDLMKDWRRDKISRKLSHKVVENNEELRNVNANEVNYLLGIFANGHMTMDWQRQDDATGQPSLEEMTVMALKILRKSNNGYILVVEGGLIDMAHHRGHAAQALRETIRLSDAVNATLQMIDRDNTLIIVTSDHSHSLTFNGYSDREVSILGVAQSKPGETPFTTLGYSTGGSNNMAYEVKNGNVSRIDPTNFNTSAFDYSQQAAFIVDEAHHGGGDVPIYAQGPFAHLLHSTHEQNYVAHVIGYASKIGPYANSTLTHHDGKWCMIIACIISVLLLLKYI